MTVTPASPYLTVSLNKAFDRASFACGDPEFDSYLRTQLGAGIEQEQPCFAQEGEAWAPRLGGAMFGTQIRFA